MAAAAAGGDGGSGQRWCRRLAEAAVDGPVVMAAVMDAMNGCMRPANAAVDSSTSGFASTIGRWRLPPSTTHLLSVFVVLSSNGGSDKL